MKVEINIDPNCEERKIVIHTDRMTEEIERLLRRLSDDTLAVHTERGVEMLPVSDIVRVYAERQKVYVQTVRRIYPVKARLYEMERRLEGGSFVRISASELVNARMIADMDFSLAGTICVTLKGGIKTYVSRRRVAEIKKMFEV